jgi:hypothetical protein
MGSSFEKNELTNAKTLVSIPDGSRKKKSCPLPPEKRLPSGLWPKRGRGLQKKTLKGSPAMNNAEQKENQIAALRRIALRDGLAVRLEVTSFGWQAIIQHPQGLSRMVANAVTIEDAAERVIIQYQAMRPGIVQAQRQVAARRMVGVK